MTTFSTLAELLPLAIWPGVVARTVEGEHITMAVVELSPGGVVSQHQHPNEQLGIVLKGSMVFTIGGERRELLPGDTYNIPGNVPHDVVAGTDGAVAIDVFSPVRADWGKFTPGEPRKPEWP